MSTKIKIQIKNRWMPVFGYEDKYKVDVLSGNVFSEVSGNMLHPFVSNRGYVLVHLSKEGVKSNASVHRIVYESLYGEIPSGYEIDHIDGDKKNNHYSNLRACSSAENKRNPATRLRRPLPKTSITIEVLDRSGNSIGAYPSIRECARRIGISRRDIDRCLNGIYHGDKDNINGIHFFINKQEAIDY